MASGSNESSVGAMPCASELLGDQILFRDSHFLLVRVPGQGEDLHPVTQRARNGIEGIGGGDEQHLREVEGHPEVVVHEGVVLGGVEHFEERGGRIAPPVRPDLVDLVEHEHRIAGLRAPESLNDAAGKGADIGPPVAPDLGFVPHPTQRHARELSPQGPRNALAQAGLAHPGRPHEAEDRLPRRIVARHAASAPRATCVASAAALLAELLHRQILEDPVLDLFEVEVILVQHLAGPVDVDGSAVELAPGQAGQPLEIRDDHAVLGRGGRETGEPAQLALRFALGLVGQTGLLDAAAQVGDFACRLLSSPSSRWMERSCSRR